ncbi:MULTISPECIES: sodium:solute symporter family protein [Bacillaceae]|jgi:cation/acetate symporter|uniref:Sodium:solute symporter n=1 Tax=Bacillus infantis NRRL B-14911 TaxID=1367477 RepID=U5LGJ4_9BACI|nr:MULTISPECIES: sodium:solute symporter family protein [Bacillus]AGX06553.1 sodium:solute symporter [Bacillus infantis NRRL B-14911]EAR68510.1 Na+/solute symporter (Ssf family) protein [Bacillus sp. NRRL B-14911]MCR6613025.1 cation acetate symporter [Bacillus infantis]MDT0161542.1 sodium:solute symporter family protein [Bacillus sp. AG4(2022)]MDW2876384.1 sodium:solute symporter family protein [Bacillus infantis]
MDTQFLVSLSIILATFALYIGIAVYNKARATSDFYVAGRGVPPIFNGMAIGADWMSAASFIGMAGTIMLLGYDGLAYIMGWTGGYLLLTFLLAPQLRKYGRYTVPEFIGDRYNSHTARVIAAICTIVISFTYSIGQLSGSGVVIGRLFEIDAKLGTMIGVVLIAFYAAFGGMKGITWTQVAQYIILIIAYLIPVIFMSLQLTNNPLPWISYGELVGKMGELDRELGISEYFAPFTNGTKWQFLALMFTLMAGTAGLPHVIVRFYTVSTMKAARWSGAWALLFIGLLYLSAPAYAAFSRFILMTKVAGSSISELPAWTKTWVDTGKLQLADGNGDGILQWSELIISNDIVVMATPEIANLGVFVIGLVAAGAMAAALSTAGGLMIAISSSFAHDIFYRVWKPNSTEKTRLSVARWSIVVATLLAGLIALNPPGAITQIVAWAFALATGTFFPALVLGVWWKRSNAKGVISGLLVGLGVTLAYIFAAKYGGFTILGIIDTGAGVFGAAAAFLTNIIVSKATEAPSKKIQEEVINLRYPEQMIYKDGEVWMDEGKSKSV